MDHGTLSTEVRGALIDQGDASSIPRPLLLPELYEIGGLGYGSHL